MHEWLTIELAAGALLATALTLGGLLAAWAATSARHWFLRTAALLVILSPLLLVPAYEPFIAFAAQSTVVALGVFAYRRRLPERRFSLATLLLVMCLLAVFVTIAFRLPPLNVPAWVTVALIGLSAGLATLLGVWSATTRRRAVATLLTCLICLGMGAVLSMFDWFIPSLTTFTDWPPDPPSPPIIPGFGDVERPIATWFFIPLSIAALTALLAFLWKVVAGAPYLTATECTAALRQRKRRWTVALFVFLIALIGALPAYVFAKLLTPDAIPVASLPMPNGYDDFIAAGKIAEATQFNGTLVVQTATTAQLTAEVKKCAEVYKLVDAGLSKACIAPVTYVQSSFSLPMDELIEFRAIARALYAKGKVAESNGLFAEASKCYEQAIRFGYACRKGGLLIHALLGMACSSFGSEPLFTIRDNLSDDELNGCIQQLIRADSNDDTYADVWQRDRVWSQRTLGWHGHLQQILTELIDWKYEVLFMSSEDYSIGYWTNQATIRLLICELAIARYRQAIGRWPESLNDIVPRYLPAVPIDPLDPDGKPLRYRIDGDTYLVYSVGPNQVDDGGALPAKDDLQRLPKSGDLRLEAYFRPDDAVATQPASGGTNAGNQPAPTTPANPFE